MEFLLVSDLHVDEYNKFAHIDPSTGMNSRLAWSLSIFHQILEYGEARNIKTLFVGGDIFDKRGVISVKVYDEVYSWFYEFERLGWQVISIVGNHDQAIKSGDVHALRPLPMKCLVDRAISIPLSIQDTYLSFQGVSFCEDTKEFLTRLHQAKSLMNPKTDPENSIWLIHQGVNGAKIAGDEILSRFETDLADIRRITGPDAWIFSGHYHIHQKLDDRFYYIGSSTPKDFGDKTPKGFLHFKDGKVKQIESKAPKFLVLDSEELNKRADEVKNNYVQIQYEGDEPANIEKLGVAGWVATRKKVERDYTRRSSINPENAPLQIISSYLKDMKARDLFPKGASEVQLREQLTEIVGGETLEQCFGGSSVKLASLSITNFMSYRDSYLEMKDIEGLILIEGENLDDPSAVSNGAGKSLIPEAIKWVLYGTTSRGVSGDEVVNKEAGKGARVGLVFTIEGREGSYTVWRYRKHPEFKNQIIFESLVEGENTIDLRGKNDAETQEKIINVLGMDERTFDNTVFFGNGFTKSFAALTDKEQKQVLERILGVECFTDLFERARSFSKATQEVWRETDSKFRYEKEKLEDLEKNQNNFFDEYEKVERERVEALDYRKNRIKELQKKIDIQSELTINLIKEVGKLDQQIAQLGKSDYAQWVNASDENKLLEIQYQKQLNELHSEWKNLSWKLERHEKDRDAAIAEIESLKLAQDSSTCPTCQQTVDNKAFFEGKLAKALEDENVENQSIQKTIVMMEENQKKAEEISAKIVEVTNKAEEIKKKMTESEKSELLTRRLSSMQREIDISQENQAQLEQNLGDLNKSIEWTTKRENPIQKIIEENAQKIKLAKEQIEILQIDTEEILRVLEVYSFWETAFSDKGTPTQSPIKSYLFDAVVPVLDELARRYSEILTSGSMEVCFNTVTPLKTGELRDRFSVEVKNAHGAGDYLGDSGGERRKVDLVIMFALHSLARLRSGSQIDCLFLDEIVDSLDAEGCERVLQLLNTMKEEIPSIFVITHNENLKNRFSQKILVRKEKGESVIL